MPLPGQPQPLASLPGPVRTAAGALRRSLTDVFGPDLHALYLYGAVTFPETGGTGDLDFHAIVTARPGAAQRAGLAAMGSDLARRYPLCADLDGWIISLAAAGDTEPPAIIIAGLCDHAWALHRAHWLAGRCVVLHGPVPASIVAQPGEQELHAALVAELEFAARDPGDAYAVLNACRILHSVADGDVVQSKFGSARWALEHLPGDHAAAIEAAMARYRGTADAAQARALAGGRAALLALAARGLGVSLRARSAAGPTASSEQAP